MTQNLNLRGKQSNQVLKHRISREPLDFTLVSGQLMVKDSSASLSNMKQKLMDDVVASSKRPSRVLNIVLNEDVSEGMSAECTGKNKQEPKQY